MKLVSCIILLLLSWLPLGQLQAGVEAHEFRSAQQEQQFKKLTNELRCLVCQNQNLADSNAELAQDLRKEVYGMVQQGQTDQQIIDFMVARYGDFVLYRPPFKPLTYLLWIGPFVLLILAVVFVLLGAGKNKASIELSEDEIKKAEQLLSNNNDKGND